MSILQQLADFFNPKTAYFLDTVAGDIQFDAVIQEDTEATGTLTEHPVEFGTSIADHFYLNPNKFVFQGVISNTQLREIDNDPANSGAGTRSQATWEVLKSIQAAGEPFSIQTGLELLENMVIVSLGTSQDASNRNALIFTASLAQVIITETAQVALPANVLDSDIKAQAQSDAQRGRVQKEEPSKSLLLQGAEFFGFGGE